AVSHQFGARLGSRALVAPTHDSDAQAVALQALGQKQRERRLAVSADRQIAHAHRHHWRSPFHHPPVQVTCAHADSVESRRRREPEPNWKKWGGKIPLPQSLDSWAIRTRRVWGHRSVEINEPFQLLQGEPRAARRPAHCSARALARTLSRLIVGEPLGSFADYVARVFDDSCAAGTDQRRHYLLLALVIRTDQDRDID